MQVFPPDPFARAKSTEQPGPMSPHSSRFLPSNLAFRALGLRGSEVQGAKVSVAGVRI